MVFEAGARLDRYVIREHIGTGSMGEVYRAHDTRLRRDVALKVIHAEPGPDAAETVASALREARLSAAISHPHVTAIFDVERVDEISFIVMEHVAGRSLRDFVGVASVPLDRRLRWLREIAEALTSAHALGIIHRDVKPENVMISDDDAVKMLDFGIARRPRGAGPPGSGEHPTPSADNAVVGTPAYMAPEHIRALELDGRADQFAWGVLAYELLTGALPWRRTGGPYATLVAVQVDTPPPLPVELGIPATLRDVVMRAMAKSAQHRFPSMNDIVLALAAAPPTPRSTGAPTPTLQARQIMRALDVTIPARVVAPPVVIAPAAAVVAPLAAPASPLLDLELLNRSPACLHLACGNVLVNAWLARMTRADVEVAGMAGREMSRRYPKGIGSINVMPEQLPLPDASARAAGAESLREAQRWMLANAVVIEGSGFWLSAARAAYGALQLGVINQCPQGVVGTVADACAWLPTKMSITMRPDEIVSRVARARAVAGRAPPSR